jgi:hypothetical protein
LEKINQSSGLTCPKGGVNLPKGCIEFTQRSELFYLKAGVSLLKNNKKSEIKFANEMFFFQVMPNVQSILSCFSQ